MPIVRLLQASNERDRFRYRGTPEPECVRGMLGLLVPERQSADQPMLFRYGNVSPHDIRPKGNCCLGNRGQSNRLHGEKKIAEIDAGIENATLAGALVAREKRHVRCPKKTIVFQGLRARRFSVPLFNTQRVIETPSAIPPSFKKGARIFFDRGYIIARRRVGTGFGIKSIAQFFEFPSREKIDVPGLYVAVRRCELGKFENTLDILPSNGFR